MIQFLNLLLMFWIFRLLKDGFNVLQIVKWIERSLGSSKVKLRIAFFVQLLLKPWRIQWSQLMDTLMNAKRSNNGWIPKRNHLLHDNLWLRRRLLQTLQSNILCFNTERYVETLSSNKGSAFVVITRWSCCCKGVLMDGHGLQFGVEVCEMFHVDGVRVGRFWRSIIL